MSNEVLNLDEKMSIFCECFEMGVLTLGAATLVALFDFL